MGRIIGDTKQRYIPRHEQDEDLWRYEVPGRDPVTQIRGLGGERERG
jgi:hypothetical protein